MIKAFLVILVLMMGCEEETSDSSSSGSSYQSELEGIWDGRKNDADRDVRWTFFFSGYQFTYSDECDMDWATGTFSVSDTTNPQAINLTINSSSNEDYTGKTLLGIYDLNADTLENQWDNSLYLEYDFNIAIANPDEERPSSFNDAGINTWSGLDRSNPNDDYEGCCNPMFDPTGFLFTLDLITMYESESECSGEILSDGSSIANFYDNNLGTSLNFGPDSVTYASSYDDDWKWDVCESTLRLSRTGTNVDTGELGEIRILREFVMTSDSSFYDVKEARCSNYDTFLETKEECEESDWGSDTFPLYWINCSHLFYNGVRY